VCPVSETAAPHRMGAALTYARRYALFTLVGIAGEDDLDAPDLSIASKGGVDQAPGTNGLASNGHAGAAGLSAPAGARRKSTPVRLAKPILALEQSAELRDRLIGELGGLQSADEAASWAHRRLPDKNRLTADDAGLIELGFQAKLVELGDGRPAGGPPEALQGQPGAQPDLPETNAEKLPALAAALSALVIATAASAQGDDNPLDAPGELAHHRHGGVGRGIDKSVLAISEPRRIRDKAHLRFLSTQACLCCGRRPSDPHHLRFAQLRALGRKVSDEFTVPLCRIHHRELHRDGDEAAWWGRRAIDPLRVAAGLWAHTHLGQPAAELPGHNESAALPTAIPESTSVSPLPNGPRIRKMKSITADAP
jgi:hypothetical protein